MGSARPEHGQPPSPVFACFQYTQLDHHTASAAYRNRNVVRTYSDDRGHTMAGMNGTRVSVVVFATSFLLGTSRKTKKKRASCIQPQASRFCSQSRPAVHSLDRGLLDAMEAASHRRTVSDVRNILLCDRQNADRVPLLFRLRGRRRRFHDTLVSPRRRGGKPHVRRREHMFVPFPIFHFSGFPCANPRPPQSCMRQHCLCTCTQSFRVSNRPRHSCLELGKPLMSWFVSDLKANFLALPETATVIPEPLKRSTLELASSHLVCSVALTGVLALQAGRWWAENNNDPDD